MEVHHARASIYVVQFRKDVEIAGGIDETALRRAFRNLANPKQDVLDLRYRLSKDIMGLVRDQDPEMTFGEIGRRLRISEWQAERREKQGVFLIAHLLRDRLPSHDPANYHGDVIAPADDNWPRRE
ncbi:MAG: hypothetical protein KGH69_04325 [Candidatus Micrarchaeota archaeon]|nr:hypothetical protein [Candidatus Micrarchaeota archaeon]